MKESNVAKTFAQLRFSRWRYYRYLLLNTFPYEILVFIGIKVFRLIGEARFDKCGTWYVLHCHQSSQALERYVRFIKRLPTAYTYHDWEDNWRTHPSLPKDVVQKAVAENEAYIAGCEPIGIEKKGIDYYLLYHDKRAEVKARD